MSRKAVNTFEIELSSRDKKSSECELSVQIFISQRISNGETIILNTLSPRLPQWLLTYAFGTDSPGQSLDSVSLWLNASNDHQESQYSWVLLWVPPVWFTVSTEQRGK